jgi:hypothetical protein
MIGRPDQAYELVLKWSVATGAVLADLVRSWASRAQTNQATAAQLIRSQSQLICHLFIAHLSPLDSSFLIY